MTKHNVEHMSLKEFARFHAAIRRQLDRLYDFVIPEDDDVTEVVFLIEVKERIDEYLANKK